MNSWKRSLIILFLGLLALLIQGTLIKAILPPAVVPNLLLILLVFLAFFFRWVMTTVEGF